MMSPIKGLMTGLIDYAGLFPPAGLRMNEAVRRYAEYRRGGHAQALGRFVVPAERLDELKDAVLSFDGIAPAPAWPLSVIVGGELEDDITGVARLEMDGAAAGAVAWARIDSLEHRVSRPEQVSERLALVRDRLREPGSVEVYFEVPLEPDPEPFIAAIASSACGPARGAAEIARRSSLAKIRAGGVTSEAFPHPEAILRFLICSRDAGVSFKATAGLHHPLAGLYPMTYEEDSNLGKMTGFLNLFLAATAIHARVGEQEEWLALLTEDSPESFAFSSSGIRWQNLALSVADIVAARHDFARSYGSCSFEEPIDGLRALAVSRKEA